MVLSPAPKHAKNSPVTELKKEINESDSIVSIGEFLLDQLQYFQPNLNDLVLLCIGTDRSTGDCLGPLVGSRFLEVHSSLVLCTVLGTLDNPIHAGNLEETILKLNQRSKKPFIIAIDACLGRLENVGYITVGKGSIKPGAGVNKNLPPIGNVYLTGIVNVGGFMEYFVLQNTRLSLVMKMADTLVHSITYALERYKEKTQRIV